MSTKSLLIALDYDKTYDADPDLWQIFANKAVLRGHRIVLATYRDDRFDKTPLLKEAETLFPVYYTRGVAKRWWLEQFGPEDKVDIWIDDNPEAILYNSKLPKEALAAWREEQKGNLPHGFTP